MTPQIDKSKLRDLIQKTPTKDLLYLHINPVEPRSLQNALKELERFIGKGSGVIISMVK